MQKAAPLSYLGFFVIPVLSVVLVLAGLYGHYLRHNRLIEQMTVVSDVNFLDVSNARFQRESGAMHVFKLDNTERSVLTWRKLLSISPEFYERIDIGLVLPENYRGLTFDYTTQAGTSHTVPVLYTVDNRATLRLSTLLEVDEQIRSMGFTLHHELMTPLIVQSIEIVPKALTVEQFRRLVRENLLSQNLFLNDVQKITMLPDEIRLFSPLIFFVLVCAVMMGMMLMIYQRPLGGMIAIYASMSITVVAMAVLLLLQLGIVLRMSSLPVKPAQKSQVIYTPLHDDWLDEQRQYWDWLTPTEKARLRQ